MDQQGDVVPDTRNVPCVTLDFNRTVVKTQEGGVVFFLANKGK